MNPSTQGPSTDDPNHGGPNAVETSPAAQSASLAMPDCQATCTDPRKARSRTKVLTAAAQIMVESGPRAVTVDAVSERSGVAKSTIYRHWDSRSEILVDAIKSNIPTIEPSDADNFADALDETLAAYVAGFGCPAWARMMSAFASLRVSMPEVAALAKSDWEHRMRVFQRLIDLGRDEGRFGDEIDKFDLLHLLLGPLVMATMDGHVERLTPIASMVATNFLAAYPDG